MAVDAAPSQDSRAARLAEQRRGLPDQPGVYLFRDARGRVILHLRFVEDLTQSEIADRIGVSQMHVSRLIRRSLARLRTVAEHDRTR